MTAVVGPVCIYHSDFCDSRVAILCLEVALAESNIVCIHCKTVFLNESLKTYSVKLNKAIESLNLCGDVILHSESLGLLKSSLTGLNGVNNVFLDFCKFALCKVAVKSVNLSTLNDRTVALRNNLNTLSGRVCTLVKLTGKEFNCKYSCTLYVNICSSNIKLRL